MTTVLLTNIPAPYREKVHEICSQELKGNYSVIYCAKIENNRQWKFELGQYRKTFLDHKKINHKGRTIYLWSNIISLLNKESPQNIIISGFSLPMIQAFIWAKIKKRKIINFTDATIPFESKLSFIHKTLRYLVYGSSDAFIGASHKSIDLFKKYNAKPERCFQSHLCADNIAFDRLAEKNIEREYDLMLCGRICEEKLYGFALEVIKELKKTQPNIKILIVGDGPQKDFVKTELTNNSIKFKITGFIQPQELPKYYFKAKIFLFPSTRDAWGVVANEACAAGMPVITCNEVGAANELIEHKVNGYVLPIDKKLWAEKITEILHNDKLLEELSLNSRRKVSNYNYSNAASGIIDAINYINSKI